jgi:TfoX C-terminal domain
MDILDAVNIGNRLEAELRQAGIKTVEELQKLGYREAWFRLQAVAPDRDYTHSLLALAGAIEGVRWS